MSKTILTITKIYKHFFKKNGTSNVAAIAEKLIPIVNINTSVGLIKFYCLGRISEWRANSLLSKEPETINWIDGFDMGETLWDVGANIGVYSLYALKRGLRVFSFEPSPNNFFLLNKNIEINGLSAKANPFCIAFHNHTELNQFYMQNSDFGSALNNFGEAINWKGEDMNGAYNVSMLSFSIDDFVSTFNIEIPNHLKIDVDGNENKILNGAVKTLMNSNLKSILIELNEVAPDYNDLIQFIYKCGFNIFDIYENKDSLESEFRTVKNHIFKRTQ